MKLFFARLSIICVSPMSRKILAAVFLAAVIARGLLWMRMAPSPASHLQPDSGDYVALGHALAAHGIFSASFSPPWRSEFCRTPGYPVFLAVHELFSPSLRGPALTQALLDSGTAVLAALAASVVAPGSAWVAGLLYALDPIAAAHSQLILTETLFTFFWAAALYALLLSGPQGSLGAACISGACLSLATLTRPVTLYLWIPWGAALAWVWGRRRWRAAAVWSAAALVGPGLWCLRNLILLGHLSFSTISGVNILFYEAAAVRSAAEGVSFNEARARFESELAVVSRAQGDAFVVSQEQWDLARSYLRRHPVQVARVHAVLGAKMLLGPGLDLLAAELQPGESWTAADSAVDQMTGAGTMALLKSRPWLWAPLAYTMVLLVLTYFLAAAGAWFGLRRLGAFFCAACLVPAAYLLVVSVGGWAYYRFRVPLWPVLSVLAAVGVASFRGRI